MLPLMFRRASGETNKTGSVNPDMRIANPLYTYSRVRYANTRESVGLSRSLLSGSTIQSYFPDNYAAITICPLASLFPQFYHLTLLHILPIYHKPYQRTHLMPALAACGAGVHMQAFQFVVKHDLQDVRMSGDK